jgi:DNA-binding MarR family transcriptional regulator
MSRSHKSSAAPWTFVTNHAAVLLSIARDPEARLRDIAERVGITERAAQRILRDLVDGGYVERRRVGRRNVYAVRPQQYMRHQVVRHHQIGALLAVLGEGDSGSDAPESGG